MVFLAGMNKYTFPKDNKSIHKQLVARFSHQRSTRLLDLLNDKVFYDKVFRRLQIGLTETSHDNFLCKQSQSETAIDSIRLMRITVKRVLVLDKQCPNCRITIRTNSRKQNGFVNEHAIYGISRPS